jgi:biopolymer transport protein ExbB
MMPRPLVPARLFSVLMLILAAALLVVACPGHAGAPAGSAEAPATAGGTDKAPAEVTEEAPAPEKAPAKETPTLWSILEMGGPVMYVLYALSLVTVALIAFHFLSLSLSNVMPAPFVAKVRDMLEKKRFSEAAMYCAQHKSAISSIARAGIENASKKHVFLVEAMNSEGARQASRLWQQISYLADISVIAPMCGLLGTVTGMLWTFRELAYARALGAGQINPVELAGGIFQALITTAVGLPIGIVATAFYSVFRGMVQRLVVSLEEASDRFADLISRGD